MAGQDPRQGSGTSSNSGFDASRGLGMGGAIHNLILDNQPQPGNTPSQQGRMASLGMSNLLQGEGIRQLSPGMGAQQGKQQRRQVPGTFGQGQMPMQSMGLGQGGK